MTSMMRFGLGCRVKMGRLVGDDGTHVEAMNILRYAQDRRGARSSINDIDQSVDHPRHEHLMQRSTEL